MTNIQEIYDEFYELDSDDATGQILFFERNALLFDNQSSFEGDEALKDYALIQASYILSLNQKGRYSRSLEHAQKVLSTIENGAKDLNLKLTDIISYWTIVSATAFGYFSKKKYSKAIAAVERLAEYDPENENYKEQLFNLKSRKRNAINIYLYVIGFSLVVIPTIFSSPFDNPRTSWTMGQVGAVLIIIGLINEYLVDRILAWANK